MLAKPGLTLERRIEAPPAKVFAAWTDPQKIARWWGPEGAVTFGAEADVRVGGSFRICFATPDGDEHEVSGTYRDVVPDERLVFTWMWRTMPERQSLVTVQLSRDGAATLLTLTHEQFFDQTARDRHRFGWSGALDKLAAYLA